MVKHPNPQTRQRLWKNKRVKVPLVLQMEAIECGAASLATFWHIMAALFP